MLNMSSSFIHPSVMYYKDAVVKAGGYNPTLNMQATLNYFKTKFTGKISKLNED